MGVQNDPVGTVSAAHAAQQRHGARAIGGRGHIGGDLLVRRRDLRLDARGRRRRGDALLWLHRGGSLMRDICPGRRSLFALGGLAIGRAAPSLGAASIALVGALSLSAARLAPAPVVAVPMAAIAASADAEQRAANAAAQLNEGLQGVVRTGRLEGRLTATSRGGIPTGSASEPTRGRRVAALSSPLVRVVRPGELHDDAREREPAYPPPEVVKKQRISVAVYTTSVSTSLDALRLRIRSRVDQRRRHSFGVDPPAGPRETRSRRDLRAAMTATSECSGCCALRGREERRLRNSASVHILCEHVHVSCKRKGPWTSRSNSLKDATTRRGFAQRL